MRKCRQILSVILTLAMMATLCNMTAFGLELELKDGTVSVAGEGKNFAALYDGDGRLASVSGSAVAPAAGQTLKAMEVDGTSYAPQTEAAELTALGGGTYKNLYVPAGARFVLSSDATLDGRSVVDGTLAVQEGVSLTIAEDAELFIDDVTEGGKGVIVLGGTVYADGWLNIGDGNRRVVGWDAEHCGKVYLRDGLDDMAYMIGDFLEPYGNNIPLTKSTDWQTTEPGKTVLARMLNVNGTQYESPDAFYTAFDHDKSNEMWQTHLGLQGYNCLCGSGALTITEDNCNDPLLSADDVRGMLSKLWVKATGTPPQSIALSDCIMRDGKAFFGCTHRQDEENAWWESSLYNDVFGNLRGMVATTLASAHTLTIRENYGVLWAEAETGAYCELPVEGVTFANALTIEVDGSVNDRRGELKDCTFAQGATVVYHGVKDCNIIINGVRSGSAHVFSYDRPYGVYFGISRTEFANWVGGENFRIYPGRWDDENQKPVFPAQPVTIDQLEYDYNEHDGVNVFPKAVLGDDWIDDPYQVKLELTLNREAVGGNDITVVYETLRYKEGQMPIAEFVDRMYGTIPDEMFTMTEAERKAVTDVWSEDEYGDELDLFAFAVKWGGLQRPAEEGGASDATHCWNAWDDVRYGTVKTILENLYVSLWNDAGHTELPDSVKLIGEDGKEWHRDDDSFCHREIDQMLRAFEMVQPQYKFDTRKITLKRDEDGELYMVLDDEDVRYGNKITAISFTQPLTVVVEESAADGELLFGNCTFQQGLFYTTPEVKQGGNYGIFEFDFSDNCSGSITVTENAANATARAALNGKTWDEILKIDQDYIDALVYNSAVFLWNAAGLNITANNARVFASTEGGALHVDGIDYAAQDSYTVCTWRELDWDSDDKVSGSHMETGLFAGNHDDNAEVNARRKVAVSGELRLPMYLMGVVDTTALTVGEGGGLKANEYDNGWSGLDVTLGEKQVLYANDCWGLDLYLNGEQIRLPAAHDDWDGVRLRFENDYPVEVQQYVDGAWKRFGTEELRKDTEHWETDHYWEICNQEDGYDEEHDRWEPLNRESIEDIAVTLYKQDKGETDWHYGVCFNPVPREWERAVDLREWGDNIIETLNREGKQTYDDYRTCSDEMRAQLKAIWNYIDDWGDDRARGALALTLHLLGAEKLKEYVDPGDTIMWGDAKASLAAALRELGNENASFRDGGWEDDYRLNRGGADDLLEQFVNQLPQQEIAGSVAIELNRDADHRTYYKWNGEEQDDNWITAKRFTGEVTVTYGANADPEDDWGGELNFRNCAFAGGLSIEADDTLPYQVAFSDSCTGTASIVTAAGQRVEIRRAGGMTVASDNGAVLDATKAARDAAMDVSRDAFSVGVGDRWMNYGKIQTWYGELEIHIDTNDSFLSEKDIAVKLDGAPLQFELREEDELMLLPTKGGWFTRENADKVTVTLPLYDGELTFHPICDWNLRARNGDLVADLITEFEYVHYYELDDVLRNEEYDNDEPLTYAKAMQIVRTAWAKIKDNAPMPEGIALPGKADGDVLTMEEMRTLIAEIMERTFYRGYTGNSAEELAEILNSGVKEVVLQTDLTIDRNVTIPRDIILTVEEGNTLTINAGCTVTSEGYFLNCGTITGGGKIATTAPGETDDEPGGLFQICYEGVIDLPASAFDNNGRIVREVVEGENGTLIDPYKDLFSQIADGEVVGVALIRTNAGYANAIREAYQDFEILWNAEIEAGGDATLESLIVIGKLTVTGGTLTVTNLYNAGQLVVGENASLRIKGTDADNGELQNDGKLEVNGTMAVQDEAMIVNDDTIEVNGTLTMHESDVENHGGGTLRIGGTMLLDDDLTTEGWTPHLWNDGTLEIREGGALTVNGQSAVYSQVWFDEDMRMNFSRIDVAGTMTVGEGAVFDSRVEIGFGANGAIRNSGSVRLTRAQDYDEKTQTVGKIDLSVPTKITGSGKVSFYALIRDNAGIADVMAQNKAGDLPEVWNCELLDHVAYAPQERETLRLGMLSVRGDWKLTLGNADLTIVDWMEINGDGGIAVTDGASVTCRTEDAQYVTGGTCVDNGDGTSTITAPAPEG